MSKPKVSIKEYGYEPNRANSLFEMENVVPTEGMRMAGKVEKHSEFMEPNKQSYGDMEYKYPYPSNVMPPTSWVGPGIGWPTVETGEDYTPRVFRCLAWLCCCSGNIGSPVDIWCSYPIVAGPWIRNNDGTTCTTQDDTLNSNEATICLNPCGNGNCPPDIRMIIEAPAQSPKGKPKLPAKRMEMKATVLTKTDCPLCPPSSACCTGVSITGQTQMNVGTSQTLTVLNPVVGCTYEFRKSSGGGTLKDNVYTAPTTNPGCVNNATINLYDKTNCVVCASITIAITNPAVGGIAYRKWVCGCSGMACLPRNYYDTWNCAGEKAASSGVCTSAAWCGCTPDGTSYSQSIEGGDLPTGDVRSAEMKAQGCCPANPL